MWFDYQLLSTAAVFSAFVLFASHDALHWSKEALESTSPELARTLLGEIDMQVPRDRHRIWCGRSTPRSRQIGLRWCWSMRLRR
jgi:hypothetical protein